MARGTALFLLPTDVMGGAENVLRMTAGAAIASGRYRRVEMFVLAGERSGTLDGLADAGVKVSYSGASSEKTGLLSLMRTLARHRYAFVMSSHTHLNAAASAARAIGVLRTERLVTRESTMAFERDLGRMGPVFRGLYRLYGAQDRIICQTARMSISLATNTHHRFAERTAHIPNPIAVEPRTSLAREDEAHIVWCGRLAPVKSPERAIEALALLRRDGPPARLTMIGDGPLRPALENLARERAVDSYVRFTGRIESPGDVMATADLGLMTSDVEGFPNVILEMLANGVRRVVTTDCAGGLAEIPGVTVVRTAPKRPHSADALTAQTGVAAASELAAFLRARTPSRVLRGDRGVTTIAPAPARCCREPDRCR